MSKRAFWLARFARDSTGGVVAADLEIAGTCPFAADFQCAAEVAREVDADARAAAKAGPDAAFW
jgi:hypothetical protein